MNHNDPEDFAEIFHGLMSDFANATSDEDRHRVMNRIFASVGQMMHRATINVTTEMKAALHATGHSKVAVNICHVLFTLIPEVFDVTEENTPESIREQGIGGVSDLIIGIHMHDRESHTDEDETAINHAAIAVFRARGIKAEMDENGHFLFKGKLDTHFDEFVEEEAARFASDIEKELGESAAPEPPRPTDPNGWW